MPLDPDNMHSVPNPYITMTKESFVSDDAGLAITTFSPSLVSETMTSGTYVVSTISDTVLEGNVQSTWWSDFS
jgi:hypothetical protein